MAKPNLRPVDDSSQGGSPAKTNGFVARVKRAPAELIRLASWTLFPAVVAGATYGAGAALGISGLTEPASWGNVQDLKIWPVLFGAIVVSGAWGYLNVKYVRDPETKLRQLRDEVATSIVMGYAWLMGAAYMVGTGKLYLAVIIPAVVQALDGRQSALEAINNAAQKMRLDDSQSR